MNDIGEINNNPSPNPEGTAIVEPNINSAKKNNVCVPIKQMKGLKINTIDKYYTKPSIAK